MNASKMPVAMPTRRKRPDQGPAVDQLRAAIAEAEARGLTRYKIAQLSGMSQAQVGRIATGEITPKLDTAEKIARAIGCVVLVRRRVAP